MDIITVDVYRQFPAASSWVRLPSTSLRVHLLPVDDVVYASARHVESASFIFSCVCTEKQFHYVKFVIGIQKY